MTVQHQTTVMKLKSKCRSLSGQKFQSLDILILNGINNSIILCSCGEKYID